MPNSRLRPHVAKNELSCLLLLFLVVGVMVGCSWKSGGSGPSAASNESLPKENNPQLWLLDKLSAKKTGLQADGSVIMCIDGKDLETTITVCLERLSVIMQREKEVSFDIRIAKIDTELLKVCVRGSEVVLRTIPKKLFEGPGVAELGAETPLMLNLSEKHYRAERSRKRGEKELYALTKSTDKEESFVFIKYKNGTAEWNECGINETTENNTIDISFIKEFGEKAKTVKRMSIYHQHPVIKEDYIDHSQTPSEMDVEGFVSILEIIHKNSPSLLTKLDFRVTTSSGTYVFKFKPQVATSDDLKSKVRQAASAIEKERRTNQAYWFGKQRNFIKENKKLAKKFNTRYMKIRFLPNQYRSPTDKVRASSATNTGIYIRDDEKVRYLLYYNQELDRLILKHPVEPVLYDEKGNRSGYIGANEEYIFAPPPGGWPDKYKKKIKLFLYKNVEEEMMRIRFVEGKKLGK